MDLEDLLTDEAWVESPQAARTGPFKTKFGAGELVFYAQDFHADDGDCIIQQLPNGRERRHLVIDVQHSSGLDSISPFYLVKIQTGRSQVATPAPSVSYAINATNVQVGNHNAQHITATFQTLISDIEKSDFDDAQKDEAKSRLRAFLESPVAAAVLGGLAQGLVGQLG
jgi:hypothetical protein